MNKLSFIVLLLLISQINCFSQIRFEKAYFIDETDQKTECLIRNMDWGFNPVTFEYKLSEGSEILHAHISQVKEFCIYNASKYIRALVEIDRSGNELSSLSKERNPVFKEEQLFLKVLIEGRASLYQYNESGLTRFFYKIDSSSIKQLVYKQYRVNATSLGINEQYKQQLYTSLTCKDISLKDIEGMKYFRHDLVKLFMKYNKCINIDYVIHKPEKRKDLFNLNLRPGLNISSLSLGYTQKSVYDYGSNNFPAGFNMRIGMEMEYILPFNANKWSIISEPVYRYLRIEDTWKTNMVLGGVLIAKVNYQSIDIPVGIRHYFHFGNSSKVFVNFSYILNYPFNSSFDQTRTNGEQYNSRKISTNNNLAFGAGYKYKDRYNIEIRYETNRQILNTYQNWETDFTTLSVILGYTLF